ncbi:MAG TPA: ABC transporter permease [Thermomicrobiales bacterium]|nr:ABC transporter permease [Thermomicrobiales bacterium]
MASRNAPVITAVAADPRVAVALPSSRIEGFWGGAFRRLRRNRLAFASAIFIVAIALAAILVPMLASTTYADQDYDVVKQGPSRSHIMGTDQLGRDIFIRLIFGARISLTVGIVVQLVITVVGVPIGMLAGYAGGKTDTAIMRLVDVLYALPSLLFVIIIMTFLRGTFDSKPGGIWGVIADLDSKTGGLVGVYVGLGLISWLTVARIVRANTMSLKQKEFVEAARGLGSGHRRIMSRHLLPNTIAAIVVATTLGIPSAILTEAGISFLGLGVIPPMPSWGLMISEAIPNLRAHPYMLIFPAAALSLTVLAFNFLGDGLRDALDPWMKR